MSGSGVRVWRPQRSVSDLGLAASLAGPISWVQVWRDAEQLIRVELWPAVQAVAEDLRASTRDLDFDAVAAIASSAMRGREA